MGPGGEGVGVVGAEKCSPASEVVRKAQSDTRSFLELVTGHLHSPWGYDEPEILRYSIHQYGPIGADAGHLAVVGVSAFCAWWMISRANAWRWCLIRRCRAPGWRVNTTRSRRSVARSWRQDYNTIRPHSKLGGLPPAEIAGQRGWGHVNVTPLPRLCLRQFVSAAFREIIEKTGL